MSDAALPYQALFFVSFGGPEGPDDVIPFLENVTRGRNIPRERLEEVAEHYLHFGGKSPINEQNRALIDALEQEFRQQGISLPIYWGNRNWAPYIPDALTQMRDAGVTRALAFVTSSYSSYSGCRQYRENIAAAQKQIGSDIPAVDKIRVYYNHPLFIEAAADRVKEALAQFNDDEKNTLTVAFTAHSIPLSMADSSDYVKQLTETCRLVAEHASLNDWQLVFQSRSGPPTQPWLEPDILDHMRRTNEANRKTLLIVPIGFISDHMEVLFDLDTEARELAAELGMKMVRAATVGTHLAFVKMIRLLIEERFEQTNPKLAIGQFGPNHDVCPVGCCPAPQRVIRP